MNKINVIIDGSGSMNEWGKKELIIYLLNNIKNECEEKLLIESEKIQFFIWKNKIDKLENIHDFDLSGRNDLDDLYEFFVQESEFENDILFISDGNFNNSIYDDLNKFHSKSFKIYTIAVGYDKDLYTLKFLSYENKVYSPEDIITILEEIYFKGEL